MHLADMVAYAGSTWDWHRLHYDSAWLDAKGIPAPVVDGQMFGALIAQQLQDWFGPTRDCSGCGSGSRTWSMPARRSAARPR